MKRVVQKILRKILVYIMVGLMLLGALAAVHIAILVYHNATSEPTPPPGGWYPPEPGNENYKAPEGGGGH